jgi:hypothetical protein
VELVRSELLYLVGALIWDTSRFREDEIGGNDGEGMLSGICWTWKSAIQ